MKKLQKLIFTLALIPLLALLLAACSHPKATYQIDLLTAEHGTVLLIHDQACAGDKVVLACLPQAGYQLETYLVNGTPIDGNTFVMPSANVEVSATFAVLTYGIKYLVDGEVVTTDNPTSYTVEDGTLTLNPPAPQDGYEFAGWYYHYYADNHWYLDDLSDFCADVIPQGTTGELTLYAHYYNLPHTITVDENIVGGKLYVYYDEAMVGETIFIDHDIDDLYVLDYFTVDGVKIDDYVFIMPNHAVEVSAVFHPIEYMIEYNVEDGENSPENPDTFHVASADFELRPATKVGCEFVGWIIDGWGEVKNISDLVAYVKDGHFYVVLNAHFEEIESTVQ